VTAEAPILHKQGQLRQQMQLQHEANAVKPSRLTWDSQLLAAGSCCSRLTVRSAGGSRRALLEPLLLALDT